MRKSRIHIAQGLNPSSAPMMIVITGRENFFKSMVPKTELSITGKSSRDSSVVIIVSSILSDSGLFLSSMIPQMLSSDSLLSSLS